MRSKLKERSQGDHKIKKGWRGVKSVTVEDNMTIYMTPL